jgi:hypothetical protein
MRSVPSDPRFARRARARSAEGGPESHPLLAALVERQRDRLGGHRRRQLPPRCPESCQPRHEDDASEQHADARASGGVPTQCNEDQEVDRGILEEVDAVGEQRYGSDGQGSGELDPEVARFRIATARTTRRNPLALASSTRNNLARDPSFVDRRGLG